MGGRGAELVQHVATSRRDEKRRRGSRADADPGPPRGEPRGFMLKMMDFNAKSDGL